MSRQSSRLITPAGQVSRFPLGPINNVPAIQRERQRFLAFGADKNIFSRSRQDEPRNTFRGPLCPATRYLRFNRGRSPLPSPQDRGRFRPFVPAGISKEILNPPEPVGCVEREIVSLKAHTYTGIQTRAWTIYAHGCTRADMRTMGNNNGGAAYRS